MAVLDMSPVHRVPRTRLKKLTSGPIGGVTLGVTGVLVAVILLEVIPRLGLVSRRYLPTSSDIAAALVARLQTSEFWQALLQTIVTWAIGVGIAMAAGVILGIVIGSVGVLREITASTIEFLRPIPSVAWIPLAILLFGTGRDATLLIVIYASFWPVLIQMVDGVKDVDPVALDTSRSYRFRLQTRAFTVVWPSALPYVVTAFRLCATTALILTLTGELLIGTPGLGRLVALAEQSGAVASMYALVVVTGFLGVAVNTFTRLVERKVLFWHVSIRREGAS